MKIYAVIHTRLTRSALIACCVVLPILVAQTLLFGQPDNLVLASSIIGTEGETTSSGAIPTTDEIDSREMPEVTITTSEIPLTPAGDRLRWLLEQMNGDPQGDGPLEVQSAIAPHVLDLPAEEVLSDLRRLAGSHQPYALHGFVDMPRDDRLVASLQTADGFQILTLDVEPAPPHRLRELSFLRHFSYADARLLDNSQRASR